MIFINMIFINITFLKMHVYIKINSFFQLLGNFKQYTIFIIMKEQKHKNEQKIRAINIQKGRNQKHQEQEDILNFKRKKKYSQKSKPWSQQQNEKYLIFISSKHIKQYLFVNRDHIKQPRVIKQMSKYIGTRNFGQCYGHQSIMMSRYNSIRKAIERQSSIHKILLDSEQIRKQIKQLEQRTQKTFMIKSYYHSESQQDDKNLILREPIPMKNIYINSKSQNYFHWIGQKQDEKSFLTNNQKMIQEKFQKINKNHSQNDNIEIQIPLKLSIKIQSKRKKMSLFQQKKSLQNQKEDLLQNQMIQVSNLTIDSTIRANNERQIQTEKLDISENISHFQQKQQYTKQNNNQKNRYFFQWTNYEKIRQLAFFNYNKQIMGHKKCPKKRFIYVQMSMFIGTDKTSFNCKQHMTYLKKKFKTSSNEQLIEAYKKQLCVTYLQLEYYSLMLDEFYLQLKSNRIQYVGRAPQKKVLNVDIFTPTYRVPQKDIKIVSINGDRVEIESQIQVPISIQFRKQIICRF